MPKHRTKMTPKQARFVEEYFLHKFNGGKAAAAAGYSEKNASRIASGLLAKSHIQEAIQARSAALSEKSGITGEMVVAELAKLGFSNMLDYIRVQADGSAYVDLREITRDQAAAIQEITVDEYMDGGGEDARPVKKVKLKLSDKRGPLVDLGKHLGVFEKGRKGDPPAPLEIELVFTPSASTGTNQT